MNILILICNGVSILAFDYLLYIYCATIVYIHGVVINCILKVG